MIDHPNLRELIEGVARFLNEHAVPKLPNAQAYQARVAANVLLIASRELAQGSGPADAERLRLQVLLESSLSNLNALNQMLCDSIKYGDIALDDEVLLKHLWFTTLDKLTVDQPSYSTYRRHVSR